MIPSIIQNRRKQNKKSIRLWVVIFLIGLWQIAAMIIGQEILLASPAAVISRLWQLIFQREFWGSVGFTLIRMLAGFAIAVLLATGLAALAVRFRRVRELLDPVMAVMKATPVASITILILLWVPSKNLSLIMSVTMVLPVIYDNVKSGIEGTDRELLEMTRVFDIPFKRRIRFVYIPEVLPYFRTAAKISIGLCWKAGVAAEVIGIPSGSIGEKLYQAKIYLDTASLFAWTVVIILLSMAFEKLFLLALDRVVLRAVGD